MSDGCFIEAKLESEVPEGFLEISGELGRGFEEEQFNGTDFFGRVYNEKLQLIRKGRGGRSV
jgi:hypothetical protein